MSDLWGFVFIASQVTLHAKAVLRLPNTQASLFCAANALRDSGHVIRPSLCASAQPYQCILCRCSSVYYV